MITADQLKDVCQRVEALNKYLNIDQKKIEFEEEQLRTQAPDFWDDPKRAEVQMKKVKGIEKWLNGYKECSQLAEELQLAFDFYKDEMQQGEKPTKGNVGVSHIKKTGFTGEHWEQFERYLPRVVYSCVKVEGGLEIDPLTAEQMALVKEEEILDV